MKFYTTSKISENIHETPEGYLVCIGVSIARTGEMVYGPGETPIKPGPDGMVKIMREAAEVFRPETISSFEGKSITILHPKDFVDPSNWSDLTNGIAQNVHKGIGEQEQDLVADLLITDAEAIALVKNGLREVSCGYEADYLETGVGRGSQKNIIGNHIALVQEGRAGSSYAINDHKGKGSPMTLKEKLKAHFTKGHEEAMKMVETADGNMETPETKTGFVSYDDFKKWGDDFGKKMDEYMGKGKDASTAPTQSTPAQVVAKDEEKSDEEKKKMAQDARDAWIDAQMEKEKKAADAGDDEVTDEDEDETEDDDFGESTMTGDAKSRLEILAPGMKLSKNYKGKALLVAYGTTDGKAIIDALTGGKAPNIKDEKATDILFTAASEVLKSKRTEALSQTKTTDFVSQLGTPQGSMTAEKLNELNAKHYASRASH